MNEPISPLIAKSHLDGAGAHEIKPSEYEDLPALTDDMLERGTVKHDGRPDAPHGP